MKPFLYLHNSKLHANFFPEEPSVANRLVSIFSGNAESNTEWAEYHKAKAEAIATGLEVSNPEVLKFNGEWITIQESVDTKRHLRMKEGELYPWPGSMVKVTMAYDDQLRPDDNRPAEMYKLILP